MKKVFIPFELELIILPQEDVITGSKGGFEGGLAGFGNGGTNNDNDHGFDTPIG